MERDLGESQCRVCCLDYQRLVNGVVARVVVDAGLEHRSVVLAVWPGQVDDGAYTTLVEVLEWIARPRAAPRVLDDFAVEVWTLRPDALWHGNLAEMLGALRAAIEGKRPQFGERITKVQELARDKTLDGCIILRKPPLDSAGFDSGGVLYGVLEVDERDEGLLGEALERALMQWIEQTGAN